MAETYTDHLEAATGHPWPFGTHRILAGTIMDIQGHIDPGGPSYLTAFDNLLRSCPPRDDLEPQLTKDMLSGAARSILNALPARSRSAVSAAIDQTAGATEGDSLGSAAITIRNAVMRAGTAPRVAEDDPVWAAARFAPVPVQWLAALIAADQRAATA